MKNSILSLKHDKLIHYDSAYVINLKATALFLLGDIASSSNELDYIINQPNNNDIDYNEIKLDAYIRKLWCLNRLNKHTEGIKIAESASKVFKQNITILNWYIIFLGYNLETSKALSIAQTMINSGNADTLTKVLYKELTSANTRIKFNFRMY